MNEYYSKQMKPPKWALKPIIAGRLKGKSDINPQWRIQAMTEIYGLCGFGWGFKIIKTWLEPYVSGEISAFAMVELWVKVGDQKSEPIEAVGGASFVAKEKSGFYMSDECFKMAITDALGVAMKFLGIAAEIYNGEEYSKYNKPAIPPQAETKKEPEKRPTLNAVAFDKFIDKLKENVMDTLNNLIKYNYELTAEQKHEITEIVKDKAMGGVFDDAQIAEIDILITKI